MIIYKDKTWCDAKQCKNYHSCGEALPYAMCQQTKECPADAGFRLPYAVRDMSDECNDYEVEEVLKMQPVQTYKDWFNTLSEKQKADLKENQFEVLVLDEYGNPALAKWLK